LAACHGLPPLLLLEPLCCLDTLTTYVDIKSFKTVASSSGAGSNVVVIEFGEAGEVLG